MLFLQLGDRGLNEPDEGRYAEMGREMLVTGDWLVPRLNGVPHYAKPPLTYWSVAASLKLFGINEWAARLPAALAAAFTALLVYLLGKKMENELAGLLSSCILVSIGLFYFVGRLITPDMILTFFITLGLYCFWSWVQSEREQNLWLWGMYVSLGLGFLDKGPVILVVVFLTIIAFLLLDKNVSLLFRMRLIPGLILVALIALPWFLLLCHMNPDLYHFYLKGEIQERLTTGRGRFQPWYYHLEWLPMDLWPWTFLIIYAFGVHVMRWKSRSLDSRSSVFLLSWFLFPFIFYSVLSSKLPTYILPIVPPISLMLGLWLCRWLKNTMPFPIYISVPTAVLIPIPFFVFYLFTKIPAHTLIHNLKQPLVYKVGAAALVVVIVNCFLIVRVFTKLPKAALLFYGWFSAVCVLHVITYNFFKMEEHLRHNSSWRSLISTISRENLAGVPIPDQLHPDGKKPVFEGDGAPVVMYDFFSRSCSFYLMKDKPHVVPIFGGNSVYEIESDVQKEARFTREDLIQLLSGVRKVYCLTRFNRYQELQKDVIKPLTVMKESGLGEDRVVLVSN